MKTTALTVTALISSASAFAPSLRSARASKLMMAENEEKSKALPFVQKPKILDGSLPGDVGFDPFGFAGNDKATLMNMREAEIKHSRLAMLAVAGWPIAELFDKKIAAMFGMKDLLTSTGESPSVLNGGLEKIEPEYWIGVVALAAIFELQNNEMKETKKGKYTPGDCGFDPLNFFPEDASSQKEMQTKEIKHGRVAMIALLGFIVQEALYRTPVVAETPFFFKPIF